MHKQFTYLHITRRTTPTHPTHYFWQLIDCWIVLYTVSAIFRPYNGRLSVEYMYMFVLNFKMKNKNNEFHSGPTPPF